MIKKALAFVAIFVSAAQEATLSFTLTDHVCLGDSCPATCLAPTSLADLGACRDAIAGGIEGCHVAGTYTLKGPSTIQMPCHTSPTDGEKAYYQLNIEALVDARNVDQVEMPQTVDISVPVPSDLSEGCTLKLASALAAQSDNTCGIDSTQPDGEAIITIPQSPTEPVKIDSANIFYQVLATSEKSSQGQCEQLNGAPVTLNDVTVMYHYMISMPGSSSGVGPNILGMGLAFMLIVFH